MKLPQILLVYLHCLLPLFPFSLFEVRFSPLNDVTLMKTSSSPLNAFTNSSNNKLTASDRWVLLAVAWNCAGLLWNVEQHGVAPESAGNCQVHSEIESQNPQTPKGDSL